MLKSLGIKSSRTFYYIALIDWPKVKLSFLILASEFIRALSKEWLQLFLKRLYSDGDKILYEKSLSVRGGYIWRSKNLN